MIYKTIIVPVKCNRSDYNYLMKVNALSADVWNYCVKIDKECKESTGKQMKFLDMQAAVKDFNELSSKNIQLVFMKYFHSRAAMWASIKAKHENSDKVKMPYKEKKYFNTMWDFQTIKLDYEKKTITLNKKQLGKGGFGKKQKPIKCYVKSLPKNIVEVELLYHKGLKLALKYKEPDIEDIIQSDNAASIDLGEIHSITSIDNNGHAIIITGRKIRSYKRLRDKERGKIRSKMSRCVRGSRQYKKYLGALYKLTLRTNNRIADAVHKISKLYLDYCLKNNISLIYYGDMDSATRNTRGKINKHLGQKLSEWNYGEIIQQITNKLNRYKIKLIKIPEYYSSQKCPNCGCLNKPMGRNYVCDCGYKQHRDLVGAMNILRDNHGIEQSRYKTFTYLRIE